MPALAALADEARLPGPVTDGPPGLASFRAAYPGYEDTTALDALRASEYWYLDAEGQTYLDYTGAGLPAQAQLSAHAARLNGRCFGNPHSENRTSAASTRLIEQARRAVLDHFNASEDEHAVIFTPNASSASPGLSGVPSPGALGKRDQRSDDVAVTNPSAPSRTLCDRAVEARHEHRRVAGGSPAPGRSQR